MIELRGKPVKDRIIEKLNKRILSGQKVNFKLIYNPKFSEALAYANQIDKLASKLNQSVERFEISNFSEAVKALNTSKNDPLANICICRPLGVLDEDKLISSVPSDMDGDMLTPLNRGKLAGGEIQYLTSTAQAVRLLLSYYQIELKGKNVLVLGRSNSVGLPISLMCLISSACITTVHSQVPVEKIKQQVKLADVIISATGARNIISKDDLKSHQVLIDCGYHDDGKGDFDFIPNIYAYTPVPGGIGPITISCLIENAFFLKYGE